MEFLDFAKTFGLPVTMALFAIAAGAKGWWYYGATVRQWLAAKDERLADRDKRIAELEAERDEWKVEALNGRSIAKEATETAQTVVETVVKRKRRT